MEKMLQKLRSLDAYPKINQDFYHRTLSGGIITLVSSILMLLLVFSELRSHLRTTAESKLVVDTSRGGKLHIYFDVTFPAIPCTLLAVDAEDISGERHLDIMHDIFKKRIDAHGNIIETNQGEFGGPKIERPLQRHGGRLEHDETYCGSCYGAETSDDHCCNSCDDVREAYRKKGWAMTNADLVDQCNREGLVERIKEEEGEGCSIHGSLQVNKVAGNFHFAPGKSFHRSDVFLHELIGLPIKEYNISHKINKLAFGAHFPGNINPLDGVQWSQDKPGGMYQYFVKVVPTVYADVKRRTILSNQFSVTEHFRSSESGRYVPGVFFFYDISPVKVTLMEEHTSFLHFITNVCAVVGGVFTVSGIIGSFVYRGQEAIKRKSQMGKFR